MTAEKTRAKIKYKNSPFPRKRESHPKLAAKEIPAYAGMERQRQKLNTAQILTFWIPAYAGMTAVGAGNLAAKGGNGGGAAEVIWRRAEMMAWGA